MKTLKNILIFLLMTFFAWSAHSQVHSMAPDVRIALIEKFTSVYKNLDPQDTTRAVVSLRLADLWSEKARLESTENPANGIKSRDFSILYYKEALKYENLKEVSASIGRIYIQLGHMYELNSFSDLAQESYKKVLSLESQKALHAEAFLALGEMEYRFKNYKDAKAWLEKVVADSKAQNRGMAAHRIAWCDYYLEQIDTAKAALISLLNDKNLITNEQFQAEVARDLSTFAIKKGLKEDDINLIFSLSPASEKIAILTSVAADTERLGQLAISEKVWKFTLDQQKDPVAQLEIWVHLMQVNYGQNKKAEALSSMSEALKLWSKVSNPAQVEFKAEMKSRIKSTLIEWNKLEKTQASPLLLSAYKQYLEIFNTDYDVAVWAAVSSQQAQNMEMAKAFFNISAKSSDPQQREASLLGLIEIAELGKLIPATIEAYTAYIENSLQKTKLHQVEYQKAHAIYKLGKHTLAANEFYKYALNQQNPDLKLKKEAADLALDSIVLALNDKDSAFDEKTIAVWATQFAQTFPNQANEFENVNRKYILNATAEIIKSGQNAINYQKALDQLAQFKVDGAQEADLKTYWKNKLILADHLKLLTDAKLALAESFKFKGLSNDDLLWMYSRQSYYHELDLDFKSALSSLVEYQKYNKDTAKRQQALLKMSILAGLAGVDAAPYYRSYLVQPQDPAEARLVMLDLIRESNDPLVEIQKYRKNFVGFEENLATVIFALWEKSGNAMLLQVLLKDKNLVSTQAGKEVTKNILINDWMKAKEPLSKHNFDLKNQDTLTRSIKARAKLLAQSEKIAAIAIESKDWAFQVLALSTVATESNRFYQDLMALPLPQGLSPQEEQDYLQILNQQAMPHFNKAEQVKAKLNEFWKDSDGIIKNYSNVWLNSSDKRRINLKLEIETIATIVPSENASAWLAILNVNREPSSSPTFDELEKMRTLVKENPFEKSSLLQLVDSEKRAGFVKRANYFQARLEGLEPAKGAVK
jgi:hypothetical protein